jgi:hypothetical protein
VLDGRIGLIATPGFLSGWHFMPHPEAWVTRLEASWPGGSASGQ